MNGEGDQIDLTPALDNFSGVADQKEIGNPWVGKAYAEWIRAEVFGELGFTSRGYAIRLAAAGGAAVPHPRW
jgi:hypothetical protein